MAHKQAGESTIEPPGEEAYGFGEPLVMAQFHGYPLPQMQQTGGLLKEVEKAPE